MKFEERCKEIIESFGGGGPGGNTGAQSSAGIVDASVNNPASADAVFVPFKKKKKKKKDDKETKK